MSFLRENDENFISLFNADSYAMFLYYKGSKLAYEFLVRDTVLFSGDIKPSPLHAIDSVECMVNVLGFLTVQKGGAEQEYFKDYTPQQLEWADSVDCQYLGLLVSDFEAGEPEYQQRARKYFESGFTTDAKVN